MREISLNGYIDDEVWFGDEITPDSLHEMLYEPGTDQAEDVHIRLNSYGGSCNAAVRMHDDLAAYPGKISITISGTAASAATVMAMAADVLEMTPGSLFMIHDPIMAAIGNEADLMDAVRLLQTCKDSIINVYATRTPAGRDQIAKMMRETTWMDAEAALAYGFVDRIATFNPSGTVINCAVARDIAEKKVQLWLDRHRALATAYRKPERRKTDTFKEDKADEQQGPRQVQAIPPETTPSAQAAQAEGPPEAPAPDIPDAPVQTCRAETGEDPSNACQPTEPDPGAPVCQLRRRLALIMPDKAAQ